MRETQSKPSGCIFVHAALLALLLSSAAAAQGDPSATREQQAARLRVAVEAQIAQLDDEYAIRAAQLRRHFNARMQELEETAESEFELSNAIAPISRVYQDSLTALQREINARKDSVYAAQNQANNELIRQSAISPATWARISSAPLEEFSVVSADALPASEIEPAAAEEAAPQEEKGPTGTLAVTSAVPAPPPGGCAVGWYPDRDRDLFGDARAAATLACYPNKPAGFVDNDYDCDDTDPTVNPITGRCGPGAQ